MTEPLNTADGTEEITLSQLYTQLPSRLAETEPYDVEAGLARFTRWVADQQPTSEADVEDRPLAVIPPEGLPAFAGGRALAARQHYDPAVTERILALEERKVALEEQRLADQSRRTELEYIKPRDNLELAKQDRELAAVERNQELAAREREIVARTDRRRQTGLILTRIASVLTVATTYAVSFIYHINLLANGMTLIVAGYLGLLALALLGVVGPNRDSYARNNALKALRLLLLRDRHGDVIMEPEEQRAAAVGLKDRTRRTAASPSQAAPKVRRSGKQARSAGSR